MGEIYKSLKKKAKEAGEDAGEDVASRIYKMPTQKVVYSEAAEKGMGDKKKYK